VIATGDDSLNPHHFMGRAFEAKRRLIAHPLRPTFHGQLFIPEVVTGASPPHSRPLPAHDPECDDRFETPTNLGEGHRCTGTHAAPWEQGIMIREDFRDIAVLLKEGQRGQEALKPAVPDR
jgi:hypothetical protein